eukprot:scaffold1130_cov195-Pinguiococcus_pyrenoidosus.AAC.109
MLHERRQASRSPARTRQTPPLQDALLGSNNEDEDDNLPDIGRATPLDVSPTPAAIERAKLQDHDALAAEVLRYCKSFTLPSLLRRRAGGRGGEAAIAERSLP